MIPNGAAYDNFPPFANSGTRSAPAEAKYAQGMVPADTFPAEWANYFFHGATAGITRLNADTGSIKKEINNVLDNFNITPDATLTNQLMAALDKLKQQAALAAHPVGSLYWTSSSDNPAVTFGGGTWVQIKDRFILAAGDTYTNGATGGAATVKLTTNEIPSHSHTAYTDYQLGTHSHDGTTGNENEQHTHSMIHDHSASASVASEGGGIPFAYAGFAKTYPVGFGGSIGSDAIAVGIAAYNGNTGTPDVKHTHNFVTSEVNLIHRHYLETTGSGGNGAHNNMPPYIVKYCWERVS